MHTTAPAFDISAGALCLDFVNTLDDRMLPQQRERLVDFDALVRFAAESDALDDERAEALRRAAQVAPAEADAVVERARELREALYRLFHALLKGRTIDPESLAHVNAELRAALAQLWLAPGDDHFHWIFGPGEPQLGEPLWLVARSAFDLLRAPELDRVRECANDECGWLFLDLSRNRSRKWCDMNSCGNRAKVRRFRERASE